MLGAQHKGRSEDIGLSAKLELISKQNNQLAQVKSSNYTHNHPRRKRQAQEKNVLKKQRDISKFSWALVDRNIENQLACLVVVD